MAIFHPLIHFEYKFHCFRTIKSSCQIPWRWNRCRMRQDERKGKDTGKIQERNNGETRPSRARYINYYAHCRYMPLGGARFKRHCINNRFILVMRYREKGNGFEFSLEPRWFSFESIYLTFCIVVRIKIFIKFYENLWYLT